MRQAIGSTWIYQLVIIFMLIFVAFLSLTINYTKAFRLKNELVSMIEEYEGIGNGDNSGAISIINNYLLYNNYSTKGYCVDGEYGAASLTSTTLESAESGTRYYYCVQKISTATATLPDRAKYEIRIFFHFSLPVLGDIITFSVEGNTIDINYAVNDLDY